MKLDIISRYPETTPKTTPLLFVHGSFTEGRIWDEHFLPYFSQQGYEAHAFSLRGHGLSEGHERAHSWRLEDFVEDLSIVAAAMPQPPVLIGHSMGGMIVQKFLESQPRIAGVVLMASVPPQGLLPTNISMMMRHPFLFQQMAMLAMFGSKHVTLGLMRRLLFHTELSDARLNDLLRYTYPESQMVAMDMMGMNSLRLKPEQITVPVLVQGAEHDVVVSPSMVYETAGFYGTEAHIFPGMAHGMMAELNWQDAADQMREWLELVVAP